MRAATDLPTLLGRSLPRLGDALGEAPWALVELRAAVSPGGRPGPWSVTDGRGRRAKLRRTRSAGAIAATLAALDEPRFPRVLARHGPWLVEEWIDGEPPARGRDATRVATVAGDLLGRLHARTTLAGRSLHRAGRTWRVMSRLSVHLGRLVEAGALTRADARVLADLARSGRPVRAPTGLGHGDLNPPNMVVDRGGELRVIDNESLAPGFPDLDLARLAVKWPMPPDARAAFLQAYARHRDPSLPSGHATFWRLCALARVAHHRLGRACRGRGAPLDALSAIARGAHEDDLAPVAHVTAARRAARSV